MTLDEIILHLQEIKKQVDGNNNVHVFNYETGERFDIKSVMPSDNPYDQSITLYINMVWRR